MGKIRILLLDDHLLFREGLTRLLEGEPDLEMAAGCASVGEAMDALRQTDIDVVLLDHDLGAERSFDFISKVRELGFKGRVLIVTAGMTDNETRQVLELGAGGVFPKHNSPALLAQAIRKVMAGETWLDERGIQALVREAGHPEGRGHAKPFTEREAFVLRGIFEGLSNKEIGGRLNISESSVKAALQQLFRKRGVRTRSQLVRIALEEHDAIWK